MYVIMNSRRNATWETIQMQNSRKQTCKNARGASSSVSKINPNNSKPRGKGKKKKGNNFLNGNSFSMFNTNASVGGRSRQFPTGSGQNGTGRITVVGDEYISDIFSASDFQSDCYAINPGLAQTFPKLSQQAALYRKYRFNSLIFTYRPTVSAFSNNGQTGKVLFCVGSNPSQPPPSTKRAFEDCIPHVDAMPYEDMQLVVPSEILNRTDALYVRQAGPLAGDIKTYDLMNLNYGAASNFAGDQAIGELRVRYSITFWDQIIPDDITNPGVAAGACNCMASFYNSSNQVVNNSSAVVIFPNIVTAGSFSPPVGGVFTLPTGNYIITMTFISSNNGVLDHTSVMVPQQGNLGLSFSPLTGILWAQQVPSSGSAAYSTTQSIPFTSVPASPYFRVTYTTLGDFSFQAAIVLHAV